MREIKFRAYDSRVGKMIDHVAVFGRRDGRLSVMLPHGQGRVDYSLGSNWDRDDYGNYYSDDGTVLSLQYTNVTDLDGTEIFEGDIVRWNPQIKSPNEEGYVGEVYMDPNGQWSFRGNPIGNEIGIYTNKKVIGNIYENPELLK